MTSPFSNAMRRQTFGNSGRNSISSLEHYSTLVQVAVVVLFIKKKNGSISINKQMLGINTSSAKGELVKILNVISHN